MPTIAGGNRPCSKARVLQPRERAGEAEPSQLERDRRGQPVHELAGVDD
jgi:hypothetical protein